MGENETPEVKTTETTNTVTTEKKGFSIASLVLGIVSIVLCCIWYISIPSAIMAIIFGILGKKQGGKGMATAGLVLGIIGVALVIIYLLFLGALIAGIAAM